MPLALARLLWDTVEAPYYSARFSAVRVLGEQEVTVTATRAALNGHPWVHITCHGDESGLILHDRRLGLDELADVNLTGERSAFLSACVSALPGARAREEALHPAAVFHLNGFSHVTGTMWQIDSADGPTIADDLYRMLLTEGLRARPRAPRCAVQAARRTPGRSRPPGALRAFRSLKQQVLVHS
ncbi:CHAT domain-containing protein [Nocardia sp. NPDC001965]